MLDKHVKLVLFSESILKGTDIISECLVATSNDSVYIATICYGDASDW